MHGEARERGAIEQPAGRTRIDDVDDARACVEGVELERRGVVLGAPSEADDRGVDEQLPARLPSAHHLPDAAFIDSMHRAYGMPRSLFDNPDLMAKIQEEVLELADPTRREAAEAAAAAAAEAEQEAAAAEA